MKLIPYCVVAVLFVCGCAETFDPPSVLEKTRILGVRVEVDGEPERSSPRPGETTTSRFFIAGPAALEPTSYAFFACVPSPTTFGLGACEGEPFAFDANAAPVPLGDGIVEFELTIPSDVPPDLERVLVFGAFCFDGRLSLDFESALETANPCAGSERGQIVFFQPRLGGADRDNRQPAIEELTVDGAS